MCPVAFPSRRRLFALLAWTAVAASCRAQPSGSRPSPGPAPGIGSALTDPLARRFYARRGGRPAWDDAAAQALGASVGLARAHGLDPAAFAPQIPVDAPPERRDEALTEAALAFAKALAFGFVDPHRIQPVYTLAPNQADLAAGLDEALDRRALGPWLASLPPADDEYKALSAAYLTSLGQTGLRAPPARGAPIGTSAAPGDQARQLAANLERRRWLTRAPPARRIDVNTAGAFLDYIVPGRQNQALRTVVGRDDHPTPALQASFRRLIVNPPWRVPTEIARKEILPKGAGYLRREDMHFVNGRLEQRPGPKCALGRVKFDVEDTQEIYLHDTPAKTLFQADERHRSHGCVRVENALGLARRIAGESGKADDFDAALASKDTATVELDQAIPVRLLYHSAYLDPTGQVLLAPDVYGWDDRLAAELGFGQAAAARRYVEPGVEFGP